MAHFYGTLQGNRGQATRCGTKLGGLDVTAASWQGAVSVRLWHDDETDTDMAEVSLTPWHGSGVNRVLYRGPVAGKTPRPEWQEQDNPACRACADAGELCDDCA